MPRIRVRVRLNIYQNHRKVMILINVLSKTLKMLRCSSKQRSIFFVSSHAELFKRLERRRPGGFSSGERRESKRMLSFGDVPSRRRRSSLFNLILFDYLTEIRL